MANKTKAQKELERRASLSQEERDAEDAAALNLGNAGEGSTNSKPPQTPDKTETVEISKVDLSKLMEKLDRQAKDIEILYKASDKSKMAKALGDGGEILIKKVNLWTWDETGIVVVATKLKTNKCEVVMGKWYEDQNVAVVLEDGQTFEVPYIEFSRRILNKVPADIVSTKKEIDQNKRETIIYKVQMENGKELEINAAFIN